MKEQQTLRVQGVLYQNDPMSLKRSLLSLCQALTQDEKTNGLLSAVKVVWGDASPAPIFTSEEIEAWNAELRAGVTLEYVYFAENTGYGKGHNRLAKDASEDLMLIMNPDILVCPTFFSVMIPPLQEKKVGLTEAKQLPVEHPKEYDLKTGETHWSSGACFLITTALFLEVGGFDDVNFFMYFEDVDLSLRLRQKGYRLLYQPNAPVFHAKRFDAESGTLSHTKTEVRCSPEANLIFAYKWKQHDMEKFLLQAFRDSGGVLQEAAESFLEKKKSGKLFQIEGDTSVYEPKKWVNRFDL